MQDWFGQMVGSWEGTSKTWFEPEKLADESKVEGEIKVSVGETILEHKYTGSMQGKPRRGEETIARNSVTGQMETAWVDSFHMNYAILYSTGVPSGNGFAVSGSYDTAPGLPRWGWKTVYELVTPNELLIRAYNVTPDGQEALAVETRYHRVSGADAAS